MVVNTIKKMLPKLSGSYPREFSNILKKIPNNYKFNQNDLDMLYKAYTFGDKAHKGQKRSSGEKYFIHCIEVSLKLIEWDMDINTVIAGMLHDTIEDTDVTKKILFDQFGDDVAVLVDRVSKLSGIKYRDSQHKQSVNFMKIYKFLDFT